MINPFFGVLMHAIGGLAAGSFYLPIKKINKWAWESAWLTNGLFAWLIVPWVVSLLVIPDTLYVLKESPLDSLLWTYFFGLLWGVGGLTFGMTMRFLGISLGMAIALGLTSAFGTIIPPLYEGHFLNLMATLSGKITLFGVGVSLLGIALCGRAGMLKDRELSNEQKNEGVKEFNLKKGIIVALIAGVLSACFAFGINAGMPIAKIALNNGSPVLWQNSPTFIVILAGGLTSNAIWCLFLNFKNKTYLNYTDKKSPLKRNYAFAALAGITWYFQFMFYGMGSTQMGQNDFASWTLHMTFIIVFSTFWGLVTKEWKSVGKKTIRILALGLLVLLSSAAIIGWGNHISTL